MSFNEWLAPPLRSARGRAPILAGAVRVFSRPRILRRDHNERNSRILRPNFYHMLSRFRSAILVALVERSMASLRAGSFALRHNFTQIMDKIAPCAVVVAVVASSHLKLVGRKMKNLPSLVGDSRVMILGSLLRILTDLCSHLANCSSHIH